MLQLTSIGKKDGLTGCELVFVGAMYFWTIVGSVASSGMLVRVAPLMSMTLPAMVFLVFAWTYCIAFSFASPLAMKTLVIYSHLCFDFLEVIESYSKSIVSQLKTAKQTEVRRLIEQGRKIQEATEKLGKAYEKFLVFEIFICICTLVLGVFFSVSIFDAVNSPNGWFNIRSLLGMNQICQTMTSLLKIGTLFINGQRLKNMNMKVRKHLEELHIEQVEMLGDKMRTKLERLIGQFTRQPSLRIMDSFDLDSSTALTCAGVLVTYLVVLLQFKATGWKATDY